MNNIPGMGGMGGGGGASGAPGPGMPGGPDDPNLKMAMESCAGKSVISGVMGFGMGGLFGLFMASMAYDTPYHGAAGAPGSTAAAQPLSSLPLKRQLAIGFKDMGSRSWSTAKNFGKVGFIYSGVECGIEGFRAKNDLANGPMAGCITGGVLARNGGPMAVAGGCGAFAAFSLAIDAYMRQPKEDE